MALDLSTKELNGIPSLELKGRIIDADVKKFHKKIESLYKKQTPKIILDISNVEFIDSHGLGIIIYFHRTMENEKRDLIILNRNADPTSYISRLFEITNLEKILKIVSDVTLI